MTASNNILPSPRPVDLSSLVRKFRFLPSHTKEMGQELLRPVSQDAAFRQFELVGEADSKNRSAAAGAHLRSTEAVLPATTMHGIQTELARIFSEATEEMFEDGFESRFSKQLVTMISAYGDMVMNQIIQLAEDRRIPPTILAETLRWLGHMGDGASFVRRRWLLEWSLRHPSVVVRDGAILGLSFLEDPRTIPALERAYAAEEHEMLRIDMSQIIADLRECAL